MTNEKAWMLNNILSKLPLEDRRWLRNYIAERKRDRMRLGRVMGTEEALSNGAHDIEKIQLDSVLGKLPPEDREWLKKHIARQ